MDEIGSAEVWLYISVFVPPPLVPCFHALFEQIKMLLICHAVYLLFVAVIIAGREELSKGYLVFVRHTLKAALQAVFVFLALWC